MPNQPPPVTITNCPMTHKKAIEIITAMRNDPITPFDQDQVNALVMATAALITDRLNLES